MVRKHDIVMDMSSVPLNAFQILQVGQQYCSLTESEIPSVPAISLVQTLGVCLIS